MSCYRCTIPPRSPPSTFSHLLRVRVAIDELLQDNAPEEWVYNPEKPPTGGDAEGGANTSADADWRLREWWPVRRLRPIPPPPPKSWANKLVPSDEANINVEGGWWDVTVIDPTGHQVPRGHIVVEYEAAQVISAFRV